MTYTAGRHFLQVPGPTNVPDSVLRAMAAPTIDHRWSRVRLNRPATCWRGSSRSFGTTQPVVIFPVGRYRCVGGRAGQHGVSPGDRVLCFETGHFATLWQGDGACASGWRSTSCPATGGTESDRRPSRKSSRRTPRTPVKAVLRGAQRDLHRYREPHPAGTRGDRCAGPPGAAARRRRSPLSGSDRRPP